MPIKIPNYKVRVESKINKPQKMYIGIYPNVNNIGVATWYKYEKELELQSIDLSNCLGYIKRMELTNKIQVTINYNKKNSVLVSMCKVIVRFCERNNIGHYLMPQRGPIDAETFAKHTGYNKKASDLQRNAAMLVHGI